MNQRSQLMSLSATPKLSKKLVEKALILSRTTSAPNLSGKLTKDQTTSTKTWLLIQRSTSATLLTKPKVMLEELLKSTLMVTRLGPCRSKVEKMHRLSSTLVNRLTLISSKTTTKAKNSRKNSKISASSSTTCSEKVLKFILSKMYKDKITSNFDNLI